MKKIFKKKRLGFSSWLSKAIPLLKAKLIFYKVLKSYHNRPWLPIAFIPCIIILYGPYFCLAQNKEYEKVYINRQQATSMVEDQRGFLWTNAKTSPLLYRYDGYNQIKFGQGEQFDLGLESGYVHSYLKLLPDGQLLSISYPAQTVLVLNPITFEKRISKLTLKGDIWNSSVNNQGEVALVTKDTTGYSHVYLWKDTIKEEATIYRPQGYGIVLLQNDAEGFWLCFVLGPTYRYNWKDKKTRLIGATDLLGIREIKEEGIKLNWGHPVAIRNLIFLPNEDFYASFVFIRPSLYKYNRHLQKFESVLGEKDAAYGRSPQYDQQGNLLFQYGDIYRDSIWMVNQAGQNIHFPFSNIVDTRRFLGLLSAKDFTKSLWMSSPSGVVKVENKTPKIRTHFDLIEFRKALLLNQDSIILGTDQQGLLTFDLNKLNTTRYVTHNTTYEPPINNQRKYLTGMGMDEKGFIWVNNQSNLISTKIDTQHISIFPTPGKLTDAWKLLANQEICLFIKEQGLYLFSLKTKAFSKVELPSTIEFNSLQLIVEGANNQLFLATDKGLLVWNRSLNIFEIYTQKDGLNDDYIYTIYDNQNDSLWLGTKKGITIFNLTTKESIIINQKDGLIHPEVVDIIPHKGYYWVFTKNGLCTYHPPSKRFRNYGVDYGFKTLNFYPNSVYKTDNNLFIVGTSKGVIDFYPDDLAIEPTPELYLSLLEYYNESNQTLTSQIANLDQISAIQLPAKNKYLNVQLCLNEKTNQNYHRYAHRIKNLNEDWIPLGNQNQITLSNLPPGNHTLEIRGATQNSEWSNSRIIPLEVGAFFYETWWFYGLSFLLLSALVLAWIYRLRAEKVRLELLVQQRTAQIEADKIIIQAQADKLKALDEIKTRFYTNITHEFRTPLTIILGMVSRIKEQPKVWLNQGMDMIQRNGNNLLRLINQLLDLQKLESGKLELHNIQGDIIVYLKYLLESFHSLAEGKGIRIQFISNQENYRMDYDPDKLLIIISNLLSNAIKFSNYGDTIILAATILEQDAKQTKLQIQVKDTGKGIPIETLPHIFNRFYQVDGSSTRQGEGTGIGLALTKEVVVLMNGTIKVESKLKVGTTFKVILPVSRKAALQTALPTDLKPIIEKITTTSTPKRIEETPIQDDQILVLIIEDNRDVQTYLTAFLNKDYALIYAENGTLGIEKATKQIPDLIISDVMMPIKDGFEVCENLKQSPLTSHIPIILLTAKATIRDRIAGLSYGADAYLAKPFQSEELMARIAQLLKNRNRLQKKYSEGALIVSPKAKTEDSYLQKVQQAVLDHLEMNPFGPNELARAIGTSRTQLHRKLKALTNLSTSNYINKIRLQEAKILLKTRDLSVSEIAYSVGFSTLAYFTASFSKEFGISPSDFRKD